MSKKQKTIIVAALIITALFAGLIGGIIGNLWGKEFTVGGDDKFDIFTSLLVSLLTILGLVFGGVGVATYNRLFSVLQRSSLEDLQTRAADLKKELDSDVENLRTETSKTSGELQRRADEIKTELGSDIEKLRTDISKTSDDLRKHADNVKEELEKEITSTMEERRKSFSRGIDYRVINTQQYMGGMFYDMAIVADEADKGSILARTHFNLAANLLENALSTAENSLSDYMEDDWERELVLKVKNNLAMTYARIGDEANKRKADQLANEVLPWGNGERDSIWEYWETSIFVRYSLSLNDEDKNRAVQDVRLLLAEFRNALSQAQIEGLEKRYNLTKGDSS